MLKNKDKLLITCKIKQLIKDRNKAHKEQDRDKWVSLRNRVQWEINVSQVNRGSHGSWFDPCRGGNLLA